ncbi:MAG: hypothetical protein AAF387_04535 [Pseudomonadota bacterium]
MLSQVIHFAVRLAVYHGWFNYLPASIFDVHVKTLFQNDPNAIKAWSHLFERDPKSHLQTIANGLDLNIETESQLLEQILLDGSGSELGPPLSALTIESNRRSRTIAVFDRVTKVVVSRGWLRFLIKAGISFALAPLVALVYAVGIGRQKGLEPILKIGVLARSGFSSYFSYKCARALAAAGCFRGARDYCQRTYDLAISKPQQYPAESLGAKLDILFPTGDLSDKQKRALIGAFVLQPADLGQFAIAVDREIQACLKSLVEHDVEQVLEALGRIEAQDLAPLKFVKALLKDQMRREEEITDLEIAEPPLHILYFCVWGEAYFDVMERYALPSLLGKDNLSALVAKGPVMILIHCNEALVERATTCQVVQSLRAFAQIRVVSFPQALLKDVEACGDPIYRSFSVAVSAKYYLYGALQVEAALTAKKLDARISFFNADLLFANGALKTASDFLDLGYLGVATNTFRSCLDTVGSELENYREITSGVGISIPADDLVRLQVEHIHESAERRLVSEETRYFNVTTAQVLFRVPQGIIVRSIHFHPFMVSPKALSMIQRFDYTPLDASLYSLLIEASPELLTEIRIMQDASDIALIELSEGSAEPAIETLPPRQSWEEMQREIVARLVEGEHPQFSQHLLHIPVFFPVRGRPEADPKREDYRFFNDWTQSQAAVTTANKIYTYRSNYEISSG